MNAKNCEHFAFLRNRPLADRVPLWRHHLAAFSKFAAASSMIAQPGTRPALPVVGEVSTIINHSHGNNASRARSTQLLQTQTATQTLTLDSLIRNICTRQTQHSASKVAVRWMARLSLRWRLVIHKFAFKTRCPDCKARGSSIMVHCVCSSSPLRGIPSTRWAWQRMIFAMVHTLLLQLLDKFRSLLSRTTLNQQTFSWNASSVYLFIILSLLRSSHQSNRPTPAPSIMPDVSVWGLPQ